VTEINVREKFSNLLLKASLCTLLFFTQLLLESINVSIPSPNSHKDTVIYLIFQLAFNAVTAGI